MKQCLLIGSPNSGKTTLFNKLTRSNKKVGNWAGVTVERQQGICHINGEAVTIVDLPGCYSLVTTQETAPDEVIACENLVANPDAIIISVVSAVQLARDLYLTQQLLERGRTVIVAITCMDLLKQKLLIDTKKLSVLLGCPVVSLAANGVNELLMAIQHACAQSPISCKELGDSNDLPPIVQQALLTMTAESNTNTGLMLQVLEGDQNLDILIAAWRHKKNTKLLAAVVNDALSTCCKNNLPEQIAPNILTGDGYSIIDKLVLHRIMGIPIFLLIMYGMFTVAMNVGGAIQPLFDLTTQALFIDLPRQFLNDYGIANWLQVLIADGVGRGLNVTLTFIPVLTCMFGLLSWLEQSGYITRAAFVVDRLMQILGLPGKSLVTMVIGFGCNVPAIIGTRTIDQKADRILTILMTPFMSCSARLGIYAVFAQAFFADSAQHIIFSLYLAGILMAVLTGLVWRGAILPTGTSACVMEFADYRLPSARVIWRQTWGKVKHFIFKAGAVIIPLCMLISGTGGLKITTTTSTNTQTPLEIVGKWITPIFAPLGVEEDNWPASVGLLTGMLAKEVVVGTLNVLYVQETMATTDIQPAPDAPLTKKIVLAWHEFTDNIWTLRTSLFSNPLARAGDRELNSGVLGVMYAKFNSEAAAFAYLLFVLLYCPCVSVIATIMRELNKWWALFSVFWSTLLAYVASVMFYQAAMFNQHKVSSVLWILGLALAFASTIISLRFFMQWSSAKLSQNKPLPTQVVYAQV